MDMNTIAQTFGFEHLTYRNPTKDNPARAYILEWPNGISFEHADTEQLIIRRGLEGITLFRYEKTLYFKLGFGTDAGAPVKSARDVSKLWPQDYLPDVRMRFLLAAAGDIPPSLLADWKREDLKGRFYAALMALPEHLRPEVTYSTNARDTERCYRLKHATYDLRLYRYLLEDMMVPEKVRLPRGQKKHTEALDEPPQKTLRWPDRTIEPDVERQRFPELLRLLSLGRQLIALDAH